MISTVSVTEFLKRSDLNAFSDLENESLSQDGLNMHVDMVIETVIIMIVIVVIYWN